MSKRLFKHGMILKALSMKVLIPFQIYLLHTNEGNQSMGNQSIHYKCTYHRFYVTVHRAICRNIFSSNKIQPYTRFAVLSLCTLNFVMDPFIYSLRIPEVRTKLKKIFKRMVELITVLMTLLNAIIIV